MVSNLDALDRCRWETFEDLWRGRWFGVRLDRLTEAALGDLIGEAWRIVTTKRLLRPSSTPTEP